MSDIDDFGDRPCDPNLLDASGRPRRDAVSLQLLQSAVAHTLRDRMVGVDARPQPWGHNGIHFFGTWSETGDSVVLKAGAKGFERQWACLTASVDPDLAPRVYAHGPNLGGTGFGWLVLEECPTGLGPHFGDRYLDMLLDAGLRFHAVSGGLAGPVVAVDEQDVTTWIELAIARGAPQAARAVLATVTDDWTWLLSVCSQVVGHGDLHLANALARQRPPARPPALLIDFAPRRWPWVFEAAYPETLNAHSGNPHAVGLIRSMAAMRARAGMTSLEGAQRDHAEAISLAWFALRSWSQLGSKPNEAWCPAPRWREFTRAQINRRLTNN